MICAIVMFSNLTLMGLDSRDFKTLERASQVCAKQDSCLSFFEKKELGGKYKTVHYNVLCKVKR